MTDRRGFLKSLFAIPLLGRFGAGEGTKESTLKFSPMKLMKFESGSGMALAKSAARDRVRGLMTEVYPDIEQIPLNEIYLSVESLDDLLTWQPSNCPTIFVDQTSLLQSDLCHFMNTFVVNVPPDTTLFSQFATTPL